MPSTRSSPEVSEAPDRRVPSRRAVVALVVVSVVVPVVLLLAIVTGDDGDGAATLGPTAPSGATDASRARVGEAAPDFRLESLDGEHVTLSEHRGTPVVLTFFASWCHPCEEELPDLEALQREHGADVQVLAVNFRDTEKDSRRFVDELDVTFPALVEDLVDNPVAERYDVRWIPQTFFIDRDGIVRDRVFGEMNRDDLDDAVASIL